MEENTVTNSVNKYICSFSLGLRSSLEYRFDFVTSLLFKVLPIFIYFFLWKVIYVSNGLEANSINGMTLKQVISYIIFVQFIDMLTLPGGIESKVMSEIKEGEISKYLVKPINYFFYNLSLIVANKTIFILPLIIALAAIMSIFRDYIKIFDDMIFIIPLIISLFISFILRYLINFCLGLIAYWLNEISSLYVMTNRITLFLAGMLFPLTFLPEELLKVSSYLPFHYIGYFPTMLVIGSMSHGDLITGIITGGVWVCALSILAVALWKAGLKKYVSVGG
ncbi:MAG: ABC transporter permease [Clostridia bacterium]